MVAFVNNQGEYPLAPTREKPFRLPRRGEHSRQPYVRAFTNSRIRVIASFNWGILVA